jgi:phosphoglycolate phosphatase
MAYTTIFFDLDGTLIDPKDGITTSVQYALSKFGITAELDELIPFIGPPLSESFKKYYNFTDEQLQQAITHYREHFLANGVNEVELYEGVIELLKKLKSENKKLAVVSSKFMIAVQKIVKQNNLNMYFDHLIATKPDESNVHKPILIKEALELYPEQPKDSFVMIGDREHDIIGAQENGIDSIGVLYGYGTEEELEKIKPTHIAKTIEDLEKYL